MSASVRFGFIRFYQGLIDQAGKYISKLLGEHKVHSQPCAHVGLWWIGGVSDGGCEGQRNDAVRLSVFNEKVGNNYRNTAVDNFKLGLTNSENLAALNRKVATQNSNLLGSQKYDIGRNFLPKSQPVSFANSLPRSADEESRTAISSGSAAPSEDQD